MSPMASQITSLKIVYQTVYSCSDQRKHQSSALQAFVLGIHRSPVNSPHKWPVTRKMFPFDDVIMKRTCMDHYRHYICLYKMLAMVSTIAITIVLTVASNINDDRHYSYGVVRSKRHCGITCGYFYSKQMYFTTIWFVSLHRWHHSSRLVPSSQNRAITKHLLERTAQSSSHFTYDFTSQFKVGGNSCYYYLLLFSCPRQFPQMIR